MAGKFINDIAERFSGTLDETTHLLLAIPAVVLVIIGSISCVLGRKITGPQSYAPRRVAYLATIFGG